MTNGLKSKFEWRKQMNRALKPGLRESVRILNLLRTMLMLAGFFLQMPFQFA